MLKKLIFHVCFFTLLLNTTYAGDLTLISSDGKSFTITEDAASQSKMIHRLLLDPLKEPKTETPEIVLSSVESNHLKYIVHAFTFISSVYNKYPSQDKTKLQDQATKALEKHFEKKKFSVDTLRQLLLGADYLDFPELIDSLSPLITPQLFLNNFDQKAWTTLSRRLSNKLGSIIAQKYFPPNFTFTPGILLHKKLSKETLDVDAPDNATDSIAISPNSKFIATISYYDEDEVDNISIWDAYTGKELHVLKGHSEDDIQSLDFSPDSKLLVSGSDDETARIWDVKTGQQLHVLSQPGLEEAHFSPDGRLIVTAAGYSEGDDEAGIWDVQTGKLLRTLKGHDHRINSAYFSPDSTLIVTASSDLTARIWRVKTGETLHTLSGHTDPVGSALFSPDNKFVITSEDDTAHVWSVETGEEIRVLEGHGRLTSTIFSSDSKLILTSSADHTAKIWDTQTGRVIHTLTGHTDKVSSAMFSPDNQLIITASHDHTARIWDVKTGKSVYILSGHDAPGYNARFSPDSNYIVTDGSTPTTNEESASIIFIWDLTPIKSYLSDNLSLEQALFIKLIASLPRWQDIESLAKHTKHYDVTDLQNIFDSLIPVINAHLQKRFDFFESTIKADAVTLISSDGKKFSIDENATQLSDTLISLVSDIWVEEGITKTVHLDLIHSNYLSHIVKALKIAAPIYGKPLPFLTVDERKKNQQEVVSSLRRYFKSITLSVDSFLYLLMAAAFLDIPEFEESIISIASDKLSLKDIEPTLLDELPSTLSNKLATHIYRQYISAFYPIEEALPYKTFPGEELHTIFKSRFSPDTTLFVTSLRQKKISVWDTASADLIQTFTSSALLTSFDISSDNKLLVLDFEENFSIRRIDTGEELHFQPRERRFGAHDVHFSPDNTLVVQNERGSLIRVRDVASGLIKHTLNHEFSTHDVQFSPNGKYIATASSMSNPRIWDVATGTTKYFLGRPREIHSSYTRFSPNNNLLATDDSNGRDILIWDIETGSLKHTLIGHTKELTSLQFSSDNKLVASSSGDGAAKIWDIEKGSIKHTLQHADKSVASATFSSEGNMLVTAAWDNTIKIWNVDSGTLMLVVPGDKIGEIDPTVPGFNFAQLNHDGTKLLGSSQIESATRLWNLASIKDYLSGILTLKQTLFVTLLNQSPAGQSFVSLATRTKHFPPADLQRIFRSFTPFIQNHLKSKYDLKMLTLAQRRRRMQRRLALRRRQLQARG